MPSQLGDHAYIHTVCGISAAKQILHKVIVALHMRDHVVVQRIEARLRHFRIVVPPNGIDN